MYDYEKYLGEGSQAKIELFKLKNNFALSNFWDKQHETHFAIKTFDGENNELNPKIFLKFVLTEISFLRDLYPCENVITLNSVHREGKKFSLVLNFAKSGCLRTYILSRKYLEEKEIRFIA